MFNLIFLSLIITVSLSDYKFKTINSYSYVEFDKNNDTFIQYTEETQEIKIEIIDDNSNNTSSLFNVYQYIDKKDVRYDNKSKQFINFVYYSTFENNKSIKKKGNYFVITNKNPEKENSSTTINYISFMPNITKEKIQMDKMNYIYLKNERVNKYMNIEYNKTYNHLFIHSNDSSLIFYIGNSTCINPIDVCEFVLENSSKTLETTLLKIRNSNLTSNSSAEYTILVWKKFENEFEINSNNYTKFYYFKNYSKTFKFKNPELYYKFNESAFVWSIYPEVYTPEINSSFDKIKEIYWIGINDIFYYLYFFKIKKNNNPQEISFNFVYNGDQIGDVNLIAVPPTEIINYPQQFQYSQRNPYSPRFLRIIFNKTFEKENNLLLTFPDRTICALVSAIV